MHLTCDPAILYFGTPVVLVSTSNEDGTANLAPISSAWWLGRQCVLGFGAASHTPRNLRRTGQCVLNLPSVEQVGAVDRLALLTGSDPPPPHKLARGYRHERDKFGAAGLTQVPSELVACPRVAECPVQLEAVLEAEHLLEPSKTDGPRGLLALEVRVLRVHLDERVLLAGHEDRVDPQRWRPLMMSFCRFFGLGPELQPSRLARIPEESYRSPPPQRRSF
jgi:flavin reductase (DIM6/NTAB) family NADH-FMN oxidoreductase RutF